jgi:hypothetical protein
MLEPSEKCLIIVDHSIDNGSSIWSRSYGGRESTMFALLEYVYERNALTRPTRKHLGARAKGIDRMSLIWREVAARLMCEVTRLKCEVTRLTCEVTRLTSA